jgi:hypothetical protein
MDQYHPFRILQNALENLKQDEFLNVIYENEIEPSPQGELTQTVQQLFTLEGINRPGDISYTIEINGRRIGRYIDHIDDVIDAIGDDIREITKYDSLQDYIEGNANRLYNKSNFRPPKLPNTIMRQTPRSARFGNSIKTEIKYLKRLK